MKTYQVSLCISNIEAETEEDAIRYFDELAPEMSRDSYEVEEEETNQL